MGAAIPMGMSNWGSITMHLLCISGLRQFVDDLVGPMRSLCRKPVRTGLGDFRDRSYNKNGRFDGTALPNFVLYRPRRVFQFSRGGRSGCSLLSDVEPAVPSP